MLIKDSKNTIKNTVKINVKNCKININSLKKLNKI